MKNRKGNGRRGNGVARTHELLERIAKGMTSMSRGMGELRHEVRTGLAEVRSEIKATNERIDHLVDILAPKLRDHEDRLTRLEKAAA